MEFPNLKRVHLGRNIEQIRELRGMKQETLAKAVGWSQQTISRIEQSEDLEDEKLELIAKALNVTPEAIRRFNGDAVISSYIHAQENHDNAINATIYYNLASTDKVSELYEKLLQVEKDKVAMLESKIKEMEEKLRTPKK